MARTQSVIVGALCLAVAAVPAAAQGVRVRLPAWQELVLLDSMRQEHALAAKPDEVYAAVLRVFADLGIPTGNTDSKAGIIGSEKFEKMRQLAGAPLSRSYSCGESATGPNADFYRLSIAIVAWVKPASGGGTTLAVANAASGNDISGTYRNPRACASTGRIEQKIVEGVQKYVK